MILSGMSGRTRITELEVGVYCDPGNVLDRAPDYVEKQLKHLWKSNEGLGLRKGHAVVVIKAIVRARSAYDMAARMTCGTILSDVETPAITRRKMGVNLELGNVVVGRWDKNGNW